MRPGLKEMHTPRRVRYPSYIAFRNSRQYGLGSESKQEQVSLETSWHSLAEKVYRFRPSTLDRQVMT